MSVIYKYPLEMTDRQVITLPEGSVVLTAQAQFGAAQLWVRVPVGVKATCDRIFSVQVTGYPILEDNLRYISTFQLMNGHFVGHVFEVIQ